MALAKDGSVDRHKLTRWCSCSAWSFPTHCRNFGTRGAQIYDKYLLDNTCREPLLFFAQSRSQHKNQKQHQEIEIRVFARSLPRVATSVEGGPWGSRKSRQISTTIPWRRPYAGSDHFRLCRTWRSYCCRCLWGMGRLEVARGAAWRNFLGFFASRQVITVFPANLHGCKRQDTRLDSLRCLWHFHFWHDILQIKSQRDEKERQKERKIDR